MTNSDEANTHLVRNTRSVARLACRVLVVHLKNSLSCFGGLYGLGVLLEREKREGNQVLQLPG
jgi:hypothetical protein